MHVPLILMFLALTSEAVAAAETHREAAETLRIRIPMAATAINAGCGCSPGIEVDWGKFNAADAGRVQGYKEHMLHEIEHIERESLQFCEQERNRELYCNNIRVFRITPTDGYMAESKYWRQERAVEIRAASQDDSGGYGLKKIFRSF